MPCPSRSLWPRARNKTSVSQHNTRTVRPSQTLQYARPSPTPIFGLRPGLVLRLTVSVSQTTLLICDCFTGGDEGRRQSEQTAGHSAASRWQAAADVLWHINSHTTTTRRADTQQKRSDYQLIVLFRTWPINASSFISTTNASQFYWD